VVGFACRARVVLGAGVVVYVTMETMQPTATALAELLGAAHNVSRQVQLFTAVGVGRFAHDGIRYLPYLPKGTRLVPQEVLTPKGRNYRVTSREQTLIDCHLRRSQRVRPSGLDVGCQARPVAGGRRDAGNREGSQLAPGMLRWWLVVSARTGCGSST
jgi:hypothetical protein